MGNKLFCPLRAGAGALGRAGEDEEMKRRRDEASAGRGMIDLIVENISPAKWKVVIQFEAYSNWRRNANSLAHFLVRAIK